MKLFKQPKLLHTILVLLLATLTGNAQLVPGQWRFHPAFQGGGTVSIVNADGEKIFFHSGINLFSYDPATDESVTYTNENLLHDTLISKIYDDNTRKCIVVAYENGNLDFVYYNGTVVNVPGIRDARIPGQRSVKDVVFTPECTYVATDFGMVVIDNATHRVSESGQYHQSSGAVKTPAGGPDQMCVIGKRLIGVWNDELYESDYTDSATSYREASKFSYVGKFKPMQMAALDDNTLLAVRGKVGDKGVYRVQIPWQTDASGAVVTRGIIGPIQSDMWLDGGTPYVVDQNRKVGRITAAGYEALLPFPEAISRFTAIGSKGGLKQMWLSTPEGLTRYDMSGPAAHPTISPYYPDVPSCYLVSRLEYSADKSKIYSLTHSYHLSLDATGRNYEPLNKIYYNHVYGGFTGGFIDMIEDGTVSPLRYTNKLLNFNGGEGLDETAKSRNRYGDVMVSTKALAENPAVPGQLWVATGNEGLYRLENGHTTGLFSGEESDQAMRNGSIHNMPVGGYQFSFIEDVKFDSQGNLWVLASNREEGRDPEECRGFQLMMLPAQYLSLPAEQIKKEMWVYKKKNGNPLIPNSANVIYGGRMYFLEKSNVLVITPRRSSNSMILYHHQGTMTNVDDDICLMAPNDNFTDQDGNLLTTNVLLSVCENKDGGLVVGALDGVFLIENPATFDPSRDRVKRLKVPRDDGSGNADYLLDNTIISDMRFDGAGRLWVSTEGSGISIISSTLDAVLANYTTENSDLPTNNISALALDSKSNRVYVGTRYGLGEFASDVTAPADDYNQVRAYPNPVRPEYIGNVYIDGLMDASLVKITDANGNTVWSGLSNGGMISWDLRNYNGVRVPNGVYLIVASQSEDGGDKGKVAGKILIMR